MESRTPSSSSDSRLRTTPSRGTSAEICSDAPSCRRRCRPSRRSQWSRTTCRVPTDPRSTGRDDGTLAAGRSGSAASPSSGHCAGVHITTRSSGRAGAAGMGSAPSRGWGRPPHPLGDGALAGHPRRRGTDRTVRRPRYAAAGEEVRCPLPSPGGAVGYCLGVDLGTTSAAAAVADGVRVDVVPLGNRSPVMPSVVYVRDDGALVAGDEAARHAGSDPHRVASEIKRRLGNPTPVVLSGTSHPATDLLAALLQEVVARVTWQQGLEPEVVVLTHPANWGPFRQGLFEEVPQLVGIPDARTTTEPEAAVAYHAATRQLPPEETVAVYDLGGCTFDAAVLHRDGRSTAVLGTPEEIGRAHV